MKRSSMAICVLVPLVMAGCDSGPRTAPKTEAATNAPAALPPQATPKQPAPQAVVTTAPVGVQPASADHPPTQARKDLDASRGLMNQAMAYMDQNRFDLAEKSLRELKAKRDSLPEFLQIQVDRLDAMIQTGSASEPQRSLKAAIMESEQQEKGR